MYVYAENMPVVAIDPNGKACLVHYVCVNTGQTRLDWRTVRCNYACTIDTTKGGKSGDPKGMKNLPGVGGVDCKQPGFAKAVATITEFQNHTDFVGECNCDLTIKTSKAFDVWENPFRDCSIAQCKEESKERLRVLTGTCRVLPPGPARIACSAAVLAEKEVFKTLCNQCNRP
jgi:hypothetical protein